jgi:hypothetical protein
LKSGWRRHSGPIVEVQPGEVVEAGSDVWMVRFEHSFPMLNAAKAGPAGTP